LTFILAWPDGRESFKSHASAERWAKSNLGNAPYVISQSGSSGCCG
jgi:hypothetical protein